MRQRHTTLSLFLAALLAGCSGARERAAAQAAGGPAAAIGIIDTLPLDSARAALFVERRSMSPHWPHIRPMVTDFRTTYLDPAKRGIEIAWSARHYDYVMSGDRAAYQRANPTIRYLPYALLWTVYLPGQERGRTDIRSLYYQDMVAWYRAHPELDLERAFLHRPGAAPTAENRIVVAIWDSRRWAVNPGDSGLRAYQIDRIRRVTARADGVFLDEFGSGLAGYLKGGMLEYPSATAYFRDLTRLLAEIRSALEPKMIMINTAEYMRPVDRDMILAAGAAQMEKMNNPLSGDMTLRWRFIDSLLAAGATLELTPGYSWSEAEKLGGTFTRGNAASKAERMKMWELASYYMLVPSSPDRLLLEMQNAWDVPFSSVWLKAQEVNIGHPRGPRAVYLTGRDPTGHPYRVYARNFDRAVVLVRPIVGYDHQRYDDSTAITVPLPRGASWWPLRADGSLGDPVTAVTLRNPEAAILVRRRPRVGQ
jgi:hypothetical protein